MKKFLGILVLRFLVCNFAEASWVIWDFEKGYVYIVLKNTENIENEIKNNSTNTERINKLGCTEGIKKQNLKKDLQDMKWSRKSFWNNIKLDGTKLLAKLNKL